MQELQRRIGIRLTAIALLVPLLIYAVTAIHIRYMADDYCTIVNAREYGILGNVVSAYQNWTGSFSTIGIMSTTGLIGPAVEPLILLIALTAWWLLLADLLRRVARWRTLPDASWIGAAAASMVCLGTLSGTPDVYQSVYWMNGRVAYFLPIVLMTLVAWLLVQAQARGKVRSQLILLIGTLTFMLGGFAISYSLANAGLLALAFVVWRDERPINRYLAFGLGMAVIGLAVFMLAPGNSVRQNRFPEPDLLFTLEATLTSPAWPGMLSVYFAPFTSLAVLLLPLGFARYHDPGTLAHPVRAMLLIPAALFVLVAVCFAPAFYAMSASLPARVWILPQFMTLVGVMAWGYVVGLATRKTELKPIPGWMLVGVTLLLAAVLVSTTQDAMAVNRELGSYAAAWDARDRILRAVEDPAAPVSVVMFEHVFGLEDVMPDPAQGMGPCIAAYYGLERLIGVESDPDVSANPSGLRAGLLQEGLSLRSAGK